MATPTPPGFSPSTPPAQPLPYEGPQQQEQALQTQAPEILVRLGHWHRVAGEIGQHHPQIATEMRAISDATRKALTILAKEHVQGQQGQRLSTDQTAQPQSSNYPPQGY